MFVLSVAVSTNLAYLSLLHIPGPVLSVLCWPLAPRSAFVPHSELLCLLVFVFAYDIAPVLCVVFYTHPNSSLVSAVLTSKASHIARIPPRPISLSACLLLFGPVLLVVNVLLISLHIADSKCQALCWSSRPRLVHWLPHFGYCCLLFRCFFWRWTFACLSC